MHNFDRLATMKLNVEKIKKELDRMGWSQAKLANELGTSQQLVNYWMNSASLKGAEPIAKIFNIDPKDLIR